GGKDQKKDPAYGADVLRLWVSSVDYSGDVRLGGNIIKQLADIRNKIRNTARFLLGSLHDFDPEKNAVPLEKLPELDRYMLHRIYEVFSEVTSAFETFQFFRFFQTVQNFCVVDLSNFYLDIAKDRLYISAADSFRRRSCQTILHIALENLVRAIAPVLCHTAEDIWQFIPYSRSEKSVFQAGWVKVDPQWKNPELENKWHTLRMLRTDVNKVLEQVRMEKRIGSSLEAKILVHLTNSHSPLSQTIKDFHFNPDRENGVDELRYLLIVSQVEIPEDLTQLSQLQYTTTTENWTIGVVNAEGEKCDRCWNYSTHVGESSDHPLLCERCVLSLAGEF
ncbi:MAG: class I tRNA ligase family protein, partial [Cylindrospermopsis raciborskii 1523720]|uniref:class I tRNA ligase family protein n=1 Tax=Cylindrospermopsis raciborskii TaxID=77022 RepID=UPI002B460D43